MSSAKIVLSAFVVSVLLWSCAGESGPSEPLQPKFDPTTSDPDAIVIVDDMIDALGGEKNWNKARYICWNFFGTRKLFWDKQEHRVRIESLESDLVFVGNLRTKKGRAYNGTQEVIQDSIGKYITMAEKIWANDSYWLVMPFKLKDPGVRLRYLGIIADYMDVPCDVVEVTFDDVGFTAGNKYEVWVNKSERTVTQWAFYTNSDDESPVFTTPWTDYEKYRNIWLSSGRGGVELSDIYVLDTLPPAAFETADKVDAVAFVR